MAVGGAVGQNMAGMMNNLMSGMGQQPVGVTPPPVPTVVFHVASNGQATGPFDLETLKQMTATGQLTATSLVWKPGMAEWAKAGNIAELQHLFMNTPPIPPIEG